MRSDFARISLRVLHGVCSFLAILRPAMVIIGVFGLEGFSEDKVVYYYYYYYYDYYYYYYYYHWCVVVFGALVF